MSLIALAKEQTASAAGNGNKVLGLEVDFEPEDPDVVVAAGGHVAYAQYGSDSAERKRCS
jgi:hypothetical protein